MRILHVISQLTKGGAERVVVELANSLARSGDDVAILATHPVDPNWLQSEIDSAVDLKFVHRSPANRLATYASATGWLVANRDYVLGREIVHGHLSFGSAFGTLVVLLRSLRGQGTPKVLETYHAVGMAMPSVKRRLHMALASSHDGLVGMADDPVMRGFRQSHPRLPYALIPNGISLPVDRPSEAERMEYRRALGIPGGALIVGTVGRLVPDRSPERIVEVFAEIARRRDDVHFFMGGEGSESRRVRALANELGLDRRLTLPGLIVRPALAYSILDLYVTLNVGTITGVAAMEAAAMAVPVVSLQLDATYVPTDRDWIYSSWDQAAVAREALRLLDSPDQKRLLGESQRKFVEEHHGVEDMASAYREFYRSLLDQ